MPPTPAPSKASKKSGYHLFDNCSKSTKAPTTKTKSGKCAKAPKDNAAPVQAAPTQEIVEIVESVTTYETTATGPVYFQPGSGGGGSAGAAGLFGGDEEDFTTLDGEVLFVENNDVNATAEAIEDSCIVASDVAAEGASVEVPIEYYAVLDDGVNDTLPTLDYMMAQYVAYDLFSCANTRARRTLHPSGRVLEDVGCVSVGSDPQEEPTGESCELTVEVGQSCTVVGGGVSLVVSDSSTEDAAKAKALESINTGFASNAFTDANSTYYVPGLIALEMSPVEEKAVVAPATSGTEISSSEAATNPISTAGAVVLGLGLVAIVALALFAIRHKRKRDSAYNEFDDDFDLVAKETSSTDGSLDDILRDLDNAYGNQVDVHHCNSAMCEICNGRQVTFIDAGDNDTVSEMYPEQYEVGDRTRSFEYTKKPGASSPRFDNPAIIRPRLYEAEDTVDL